MKRFSHLLKATFLLLSLIPGILSAQDTLTIVAVGDVMLGTIFPKRSDLADEETAKHFFDEVKPYFEGGDIVFCNMEGVLADSLVKECKMFCFGMPSSYIKYYKDAGFNFQYTFLSKKETGKTLYDIKFTEKDYKKGGK